MATPRGNTSFTDRRGSISERKALLFLQPEKHTERILLNQRPGRRRALGPLAQPAPPLDAARTPPRCRPGSARSPQPGLCSKTRGLGRLGAGMRGNTSGPSTMGTERISGTEGEKRGPSPAPSFQK